MPGGRPAPEPRGLLDGLLSLVGSFGRYVQAIGALAGEEAHEAVALYLRLAIMLVASILFVAFGYVFLVLFAAFLVATVFHVAWLWILLGLTALHFLVAVICAAHVKSHWRTPVFSATKGEISRDLSALSNRQNP